MYFPLASITAVLLSISTLVQASNVVDLTPDTFGDVVGKGKFALVEFFAPWCGHCKKLAPIYEELADAYSHTGEVVIAKVDADEHKTLGTKYDVKGFPTIKWFNKDGKAEDYQGGRELSDLAAFVSQKSGLKSKIKPPPAPITPQLTWQNFDKTVLDPTKDVLVSFTASWCGHCKAMKPTFEQVTKTFRPEKNVVIANFESDTEANRPLAQKYEITSFPTLKFFPKGSDKTPIPYEGGRTEEDFVDYLNEKCGTYRAVGGGLNEEAGRIEKLDDLAYEFFTAVPESRQSIYKKAVKAAGSSREYGKHYIRVMDKVLNGTVDYVEKETTRLASILKKRTLSEEKLDQIKVKSNILAAFAAEKAEEAAEAAEAVKEGAEEKVKAAAESVASEAQRVKEEL